MISRVTQQTVRTSTLANLQGNLRTMADLQARLSSGKNISKASDDPSATGRTMSLRADYAAATQAKRNADDGVTWLSQTDSSLQTTLSVLRRARDLTVQGANSGVVNGVSAEAIATELEGLRDTLLDVANTTLNGRQIFAGTSVGGTTFTDASGTPPYAWQGTAAGSVDRRIGADATVRVDTNGEQVFGEGDESVFALLDSIAADLRNGVPVSTRLNEIDDRMNTMLAAATDVGVRMKQVTDVQSSLALRLQDLSSAISGIEDIDLAQTVMELQMQEVAYQGALGATARVLQPSLMDFLR